MTITNTIWNKFDLRVRKPEKGVAPVVLTGDQLFEKVKYMHNKFGKPFAKDLVKSGWKKKSIFFELPYRKSMYVRHFLDATHIEKKNVFDSIIGTLLNVLGKSKDGINARLDLMDLGIKTELAPVNDGKHTFLPPVAHTLSRKEKKYYVSFFMKLKFQKGTHQTSVIWYL